jgi:hypothetical protein
MTGKRADYVIIDRHYPGYLNVIEKEKPRVE